MTSTRPMPGGEMATIRLGDANSTRPGRPPNVTLTRQNGSNRRQDRPEPVIRTGVCPNAGPTCGRTPVTTGPLTVIDSQPEVTLCGVVSESVTLTLKEYVPVTSGKPWMTPVAEARFRPGGRNAAASDQEHG